MSHTPNSGPSTPSPSATRRRRSRVREEIISIFGLRRRSRLENSNSEASTPSAPTSTSRSAVEGRASTAVPEVATPISSFAVAAARAATAQHQSSLDRRASDVPISAASSAPGTPTPPRRRPLFENNSTAHTTSSPVLTEEAALRALPNTELGSPVKELSLSRWLNDQYPRQTPSTETKEASSPVQEQPVRYPFRRETLKPRMAGTSVKTSTPLANGTVGHANGTASGGIQMTILKDASLRFEKKMQGLRTSSSSTRLTTKMTIDDFLDYIAAERLRRHPHRGGRWDRVLKWAEYFSTQVSIFEQCVRPFLLNSGDAAQIVFASCHALLELGPSQAQALGRAFKIFYEFAVTLQFYVRHQDLFDISEVRPELAKAYIELVTLVTDVAVHYSRHGRSMKGSQVTVNFQALFGRTIQAFFRRKDNVANAMWTYRLQQSSETKYLSLEISTLRSWLGSQSSGLPTSLSNPKAERVEFSCEWFQPHLADFIRSNDDVFAIEGSAGVGKSVLSHWIVERLQRPISHRYIEAISFFLDAAVPSESTSLSLVKGLLVQLLEQNVRDVQLYKGLSNVYELSTKSGSNKEVEIALWEVVEHAVKNANDMVICIDGLNEINGNTDDSARIFKNLHGLATRYFGVRVILTSQQVPSSYSKTKHFIIKPEYTQQDIFNLARHFLTARNHMTEEDKSLEPISEKVTEYANGSFVVASLLLYLLAREKTPDTMMQRLSRTNDWTTILTTLVESAITMPVMKQILSWLLICEQPLTVEDLRSLLEVDPIKGVRSTYPSDIKEDLLSAADSLLVIHDGVVRFRHLSIGEHLRQISGKILMPLPLAHIDLITRMLLHVKLSVPRDEPPSTEGLEPAMVDQVFHDITLLSYVVRNWITHFNHTSVKSTQNSIAPNVPNEFKNVFPKIALFPLLEKTVWETDLPLTEVVERHILALNIRQTILGKNNPSVLQAYLNVATTYQKIGDTSSATKYWYSAFTISKIVMGQHNSLTLYFASLYLELVQTIKATKRDEITNNKEDTLKYLVAHSRHEHGDTSDDVIKYKRMLATLYTAVDENELASNYWREVYEASVTRHGVGSKEVTEVSRDLTTVLAKDKRRDEIVQYTRPVFDTAEATMDITDTRRLDATIHMAETYEGQRDFNKAEELYLTLWMKLSENAHRHKTVEAHQKMIEVVLYYVRFLRRYGRNAEASNTLIGVWSEYERADIESDIIATRLTTVGKELKELGVASVSLGIFVSLWTYFKRTKRTNSKDAADVAILLTSTSKDVATDDRSTTSYASILMEVFQATFSSGNQIRVDATTIHTCNILSLHHVQLENWSEAVEICAKVLSTLWIGLSQQQAPEVLPEQYIIEATELALREAYCRYKLTQVDRAEKIYLYVFRATKTTLKIDDSRVANLVDEVIKFYTNTNQHDSLMAFYEELLSLYRRSLGAANTCTINTLYALAALCTKHKPARAEQLYIEILESLNKDFKVCHQQTLDAAIALSYIYYDARNWKSALTINTLLWQTITQRSKEYGIRADFVQSVYEKYTFILRTENKAEYAVLRQIAVEYQQIAVAVFGEDSEIALEATILLAEINSQQDRYHQDAIRGYEQAFKKSEKTSTSNPRLLTMISNARSTLSKLYMKNATTSTENNEKATTLYREQYTKSRDQYGYSHRSTLDSIRGLILLWIRDKNAEKTNAAKKELSTSTVSIVNTEKDSKKLYESAISLASTYISAGLVKEAYDLLAEMRRQIVFRDMSRCQQTGIKMADSVDRSSYIFLVTFEDALKGNGQLSSFSAVYTDIMTERILYQSYRTQFTANTRFDLSLLAGARLHAFLIRKQRVDQIKQLEDELFEMFMKVLGAEIRTDRTITRRFFLIMLDELAKERHSPHLGNAACVGGNNRVQIYLKESKFQDAYGLALCVYQFVSAHRGYHHQGNVGNGFKLSLYLAGRGVPRCPDQALYAKMIALSREVLKNTLDACRHLKVEFVAMQLGELDDLVALMGEQKNYDELEWLLTQLWQSRHSQSSWSSQTVVSIGRRLVQVRFAHGHTEGAIHLCQDIVYNLRYVLGPLDKATIDMSNLLSSLFTAARRHTEAIAVHEGILQEQISGDDDSSSAVSSAEAAEVAKGQVEMLKRTYIRNGGKWDKDAVVYKDMFAHLSNLYGKEKSFQGMAGFEGWKSAKDDGLGTFQAPTNWNIETGSQSGKKVNQMRRRRDSGFNVLMNGGITKTETTAMTQVKVA